MEKNFLLSIMIVGILTVTACGGGGGGSSSGNTQPPALSAISLTVPSVEADAAITLTASASDDKGKPLSGVEIKFSIASGASGALSSTSVTTDDTGQAATTLTSEKIGFVTVKAEAGGLSKQVTVHFNQSKVASGTLLISIDANGDGSYNEPTDFYLPADGHAKATVKIKLTDLENNPISNKTVTFSSDYAGVLSADGSVTDANGEAVVNATVASGVESATNIVLILVSEPDTGAQNMLSFYLEPLTVKTVEYSYPASSVRIGGTVPITVYAYLKNGAPAPDGTIVNMSSTLGHGICPVAGVLQSGKVIVPFTNDGTSGTASIDIFVGGVKTGFTLNFSR